MTDTVARIEAPAPAAPQGDRAAPRTDWAEWIGWAGAVAAVAAVALYLVVALIRIRYPYELEWMEGGVVDHVRQVLHGKTLYGPPSVAFTPYLYTPLYYGVSALVAAVTGLGYFPLRLVSLLSSLVAFAAVGRLVHLETSDRRAGLVGAGLFAACFRIGGAWFDLARVDSLFLALLFSGLVVARRATTPRRFAAAGLVLSLAFLAKQQALFPAIAVLPWAWHVGRRQAAAYAATVAAVIVGSTAAFALATHGWYVAYVFDLPSRHPLDPAVWHSFWTHDLVRALPLATVGAAAAVVARWRLDSTRWFLVPVSMALVATSFSSRLHTGGYDNVLLPAYGDIAVLAAVGFAAASAWRPRRGWWRSILVAAAVIQLAALAYDPRTQLPTSAEERAGRQLLAALRSLDGPVYLPGHGWYAERAGQQPSAQGAAIGDVLRAPGARGRAGLAAELRAAVDHERFAYVVVDSAAVYSYLPPTFAQHYRPLRQLGSPEGTLVLPVTGTRTAPAVVWERRGVPDGH